MNSNASAAAQLPIVDRRSGLPLLHRVAQAQWLRCAILLVTGALARAPGLQGQPIWDDHFLVLSNPFIRSPLLIIELFRHRLFLDGFGGHYRPMQNVSYMFDYYFWGTNVYGFHLTNILLHACSGMLLYLLLRKILVSLWFRRASAATRERLERRIPAISLIAFFVALVWTVHPVHSAAVDYMSGRADSLAFLFGSAGWLLFFRARSTRPQLWRRLAYAVAFTCGLFALLSREIALVWLALFLAHLLLVERHQPLRSRIAALAVSLMMVIAYGAFRSLPEPTSAARPSREWPVAFKAVLMARAMGDYTRLMIFPSNLHMDRSIVEPRSYTSRSTWRSSAQVEYLSLLGGVAFAALAFGCMRPGKGRRLRVFGAGWFVVGYLPVSNIVQLNASVAEHWLYLPSVGFLIFIAGCLVELPPKFRRVTVAAACLACIALAGRSVARSSDWSDEETFYTRTYDSGGTSIRVSSNLAQVYSAKGDLPAAERVFRKVLEIDPSYPSARNNLANLLRKQGRVAEADQLSASTVQASAKTRKEYPRTWMAAVNLATHRREQGDFAAALEIATRTRRDYPRIWEAVRSEAELLRLLGRHEEGLQLVSDYVQQHWWHHGASMALGQLYAQANDAERAAEAWRHASRLDVRDAESLSLLAAMRVRQNRLEEAAETQRRAVARQPDEPSRYRQLAAILERMGRTDEARVAQSHFARLQTLAAQPAISR